MATARIGLGTQDRIWECGIGGALGMGGCEWGFYRRRTRWVCYDRDGVTGQRRDGMVGCAGGRGCLGSTMKCDWTRSQKRGRKAGGEEERRGGMRQAKRRWHDVMSQRSAVTDMCSARKRGTRLSTGR